MLAAVPVATALVLAAVMAGCGSGHGDSAIVAVDGSSTVFPISEAIAEEHQRQHPDARITVGVSGTGGGFQKFCRGETAINNASRPIRAPEVEACRKAGIDFIELPVAYDGLAVVVHPRNDWAGTITIEELRRLWAPDAQGRVTRWNQVRASWPDREIRLFGAGVDSGTYDYFTEAVVGEEGASRGDFTSSEDDNVLVQGVSGDALALGFLPLAYVQRSASSVTLVAVDDGTPGNGDGPILPSAETVRDGTYQPLSRPLFVYVASRAAGDARVRAFVASHFSSPEILREVGYVPLTPREYELAGAHFAQGRTGPFFSSRGSDVGPTLERLLAEAR